MEIGVKIRDEKIHDFLLVKVVFKEVETTLKVY
jgi:hypothetical protein